MRILLFILPLLLQLPLKAQPGCTDPQATNFDPAATENDGSCIYPSTTFTPILVGQLPPDMEECSGLAFFENKLWTHLDGGNPDHIYTLDTLTAEKLETITIPNADNFDWEDMAEDAQHLYIGDFGNNSGNRTDLRIYKIKKSDFTAGTIFPELIEFNFSDQTNFTHVANSHNYDCEAFFAWGDSLHLFSKNWTDFKTRHYVLPVEPGLHTAELRDSLEVQGQITAADISDEGRAVLLGYNTSTSETFMWLLFDYAGNDFFSGNKRRISLGSAVANSQTEGIVFRDSTRGYICSEKFSVLPQKLLSFDIKEWVENTLSSTKSLFSEKSFSIHPNPVDDIIYFKKTNEKNNSSYQIKIFDSMGRPVFFQNMDGIENRLDLSGLQNGIYTMLIMEETDFWVEKIFKM